MTEYRRFQHPGGTWLFTVNLAERRGNRLLVEQVEILRAAFADVKRQHPFKMNAVVILPEHLHSTAWMQEVEQRMERLPSILTLPPDDSDFSTRWALIKAYFSHRIVRGERISSSRQKRGERGIYPRA